MLTISSQIVAYLQRKNKIADGNSELSHATSIDRLKDTEVLDLWREFGHEAS